MIGVLLAERISELTGILAHTVRLHLAGTDFLQDRKSGKGGIGDPVSRTRQVVVSESVDPAVYKPHDNVSYAKLFEGISPYLSESCELAGKIWFLRCSCCQLRLY